MSIYGRARSRNTGHVESIGHSCKYRQRQVWIYVSLPQTSATPAALFPSTNGGQFLPSVPLQNCVSPLSPPQNVPPLAGQLLQVLQLIHHSFSGKL